MKPASPQLPSNFAAATHHAVDRRSVRAAVAGFVQDSGSPRVVQCVKTLLDSFTATGVSAPCEKGCGQLVGAVIVAIVEGELRQGDPFPGPAELARACNIPLAEALDAVADLMTSRILQQDRSGALHIHPTATPTLDMKQQAFLVRARQLVEHARQWNLSSEGVRVLFDRATHDPS